MQGTGFEPVKALSHVGSYGYFLTLEFIRPKPRPLDRFGTPAWKLKIQSVFKFIIKGQIHLFDNSFNHYGQIIHIFIPDPFNY